MEAVVIPAKTVVHIGGVPVRLAVDTIVETAYDDMARLTGYHYAHLQEAPEGRGVVNEQPSSAPAEVSDD